MSRVRHPARARPRRVDEATGLVATSITALTCSHLPARTPGLLGVCTTVLKKICRENGIRRWPQRALQSINKMMSSIELSLQTCSTRPRPSPARRATHRSARTDGCMSAAEECLGGRRVEDRVGRVTGGQCCWAASTLRGHRAALMRLVRPRACGCIAGDADRERLTVEFDVLRRRRQTVAPGYPDYLPLHMRRCARAATRSSSTLRARADPLSRAPSPMPPPSAHTARACARATS